jgi:hypothetical protein
MTKFEAASIAFARAAKAILQHTPQGLSMSELRALNDGLAGMEAAAAVPAHGHRATSSKEAA